MHILKRVYAAGRRVRTFDDGVEIVIGPDNQPYIVNIGYHAGVVNMVVNSPTPSDVLVNGKVASRELIEEILEKIKMQFHYKECGYSLEEA